jgi:FAD/FMN-containing dehydrogenase
VPVSATATTLRRAGFNVVIASQWSNPADTERGMAWARETFAALTPHLAPARYLNYLEADAPNAAEVAYGSNLPRLRAIKAKFDPTNVFCHNVNILPV